MFDIVPNLHPIFVHFTVALFLISVLFYGLSIVSPIGAKLKQHWLITANWCLWSGAVMTVATVLAGFYAYGTVNHDGPSHLAMTDHRNWALATVVAFALLTAWSLGLAFKKAAPKALFLLFALISAALLSVTGWKGGEIVYRHGLGVMSLPKSTGEGHDHEHAAGQEHGDAMKADGQGDKAHGHDGAMKGDGHHDSMGGDKSHDHGDSVANESADTPDLDCDNPLFAQIDVCKNKTKP